MSSDSEHPPAPEKWTQPLAPEPAAAPALGRGSSLGRYLLLERVGAGSMGVVYAAYDPDLDRKVAIKLLSPGATGTPVSAGPTRLLREAQALAKVVHPHVVVVHDVGTYEGLIYITTEFIDGRSLAEWLRERPRTWREILDVFLAAGQGLAAAHEGGIIHRDFKPENVLVRKDGVVKVVDFGLARRVAAPADEPDPAAAPPDRTTVLDHELTQTGAVMGTPAFMAPEQHRGTKTDGRTDQFAFSVALWAALFGERPFRGATSKEIGEAVLAGRLETPPPGDAPPRILAILRRGLRTEPGDRYPTMAALLAELSACRTPPARRRNLLVAGAAVLLVAGGGLAARVMGHHAPACRDAAERLAGVWDARVRAAVEAAFTATHLPHAEDTYRRVAERLDAYTGDWTVMRNEACAATVVRGEQSPELMDLRMQCLDRRLQTLGALTALFAAAPDARVLDRAVSAAGALEELAGCADADALRAHFPPPGAALAPRVAELRGRLDRASALLGTGKWKEGIALATAVVGEARAAGYPPLLGDALRVLAELNMFGGKPAAARELLEQGLSAAADARDDERVAQLSLDLVFVVGAQLRHPQEALALQATAEAALHRAGNPPRLRAGLRHQVATVLEAAGKYAEAEQVAREAVALYEKLDGPEAERLVSELNLLGNLLITQGRSDEARSVLERALAIQKKRLGPAHPRAAYLLLTLGNVEHQQGRNDAALEDYRAGLAIAERSADPESLLVAALDVNVGMILSDRDELDQAIPFDVRALAIQEKLLGPDDTQVAGTLTNLGSMWFAKGEHERGRRAVARAVAIREKLLGADHPDLVVPLCALGEFLLQEGRFAEAMVLLQRALAIAAKGLPADHPTTAEAHADLAACMTGLGRPAEALPLLEQAIPVLDAKEPNTLVRGSARFTLARTLWAAGQRERALAAAAEAHDILAALGVPGQRHLRELDAWRAGLR